MEIRTARLLLRRARRDDLDALHAILSDPRAMRYMGRLPHDRLEQTAEWIEELLAPQGGNRDLFLAEHKGRVIGRLGIWQRPEIGFAFHPAYWGRGLASEALGAFIQHIFATTTLAEITADVDPRNTACLTLLTRLGFVITGEAKDTVRTGDEWSDSLYLSLPRPR